jgi:predicted Zn-dependent peptidase
MRLLYHSLQNGIRLVHYRTNGMISHCGLLINTGSRDEKLDEHGIVHMIEHMLFKGTKKRKAYHILSGLEDVGGELNAYTTKEETVVYASVLNQNFEKAIDIISDIVFNSVFPEKEISKEKDVITEEINSYLDTPAELIFDEFEEQVFRDYPIGRNILGTTDSVKTFNQESLSRFVSKKYSPESMVFCSVGNIDDPLMIRLFTKYFEEIPYKKNGIRKKEKINYKPSSVTKIKDTYQNHCIIGNIAYNLKNKRRLGMFLLNNILGGQGMNSRLNMSLRERNGLAYNVESGYNAYSDTGVFTIYFGTENKNLNKCVSIVMKELERLRNKALGTVQISKAKNQIKGYLARGYENHESLMLSLGKNMMVFNKVDTLGELCKKIDMITSDQLLEIANEVFEPSQLSILTYK